VDVIAVDWEVDTGDLKEFAASIFRVVCHSITFQKTELMHEIMSFVL
jgi:hypothetical protein